MNDATFRFGLVCMAVAFVSLVTQCAKPECVGGFTPTHAMFVGWYCVPGYDPDG